MPGMLSGSLIVFGLSASAFAIPGLLGGRRLKMVATVVYDEYLHELNWPLGAAIALTLLLANLVIMLATTAWSRRALQQDAWVTPCRRTAPRPRFQRARDRRSCWRRC